MKNVVNTPARFEKKSETPAAQLKNAVLLFNADSADRTVIDESARWELETIQERAFAFIDCTYSDRQTLPTASAIEAQTGELAEKVARFVALCLGMDKREIAGVEVEIPAVESLTIRGVIQRTGREIVQTVDSIEQLFEAGRAALATRDAQEESALLEAMNQHPDIAKLVDLFYELHVDSETNRQRRLQQDAANETAPVREAPIEVDLLTVQLLEEALDARIRYRRLTIQRNRIFQIISKVRARETAAA